MNFLSIKLMLHPVAELINMPWFHGLKARHEQQKEPDYLKMVM